MTTTNLWCVLTLYVWRVDFWMKISYWQILQQLVIYSKFEPQKIGKSFWIFPDLVSEDTCWSSLLILELDYIHLSFETWIIQKYMTDIECTTSLSSSSPQTSLYQKISSPLLCHQVSIKLILKLSAVSVKSQRGIVWSVRAGHIAPHCFAVDILQSISLKSNECSVSVY